MLGVCQNATTPLRVTGVGHVQLRGKLLLVVVFVLFDIL